MSREIERTRHDLEDREPEQVVTKFFDEEGNEVTVDAGNPLPVEGSASIWERQERQIELLGRLVKSNEELLIYAKEALDGELI